MFILLFSSNFIKYSISVLQSNEDNEVKNLLVESFIKINLHDNTTISEYVIKVVVDVGK